MDFDLIERLAHLSERTLPVQALKTMQVRVKVPDLIDTIRKNREAHLLIYGQAKAKYIEQAIAAVERKLSQLREGHAITFNPSLIKPVSRNQ